MPVADSVTKKDTPLSKDLTAKTPINTPEKYVFGRPTVFKNEYCQQLIDHMATGLSFEAFAGAISVTKDTLYDWCEKFPDFSYAKQTGTQKSRMFWEKLGVDHIINSTETIREGKDQISTSKSLNAAVWIFNMKNRFRDEWRDKQEVDHSVKNGDKPPLALSYNIPLPEREVGEENNIGENINGTEEIAHRTGE